MYTPFPYQGKDAKKIQLATRIPQGLFRELKLYCIENNVSITDELTSLLRRHLYLRKYAAKIYRIK